NEQLCVCLSVAGEHQRISNRGKRKASAIVAGEIAQRRMTKTNCVDGDIDGEESVENNGKPSPRPDYVFSVGEESSSQSSGTATLVLGGVHLSNVLIDSGATCNILG
ncbi:hypothetical protein OS493_025676, partial [Desmophyllum pertusum]